MLNALFELKNLSVGCVGTLRWIFLLPNVFRLFSSLGTNCLVFANFSAFFNVWEVKSSVLGKKSDVWRCLMFGSNVRRTFQTFGGSKVAIFLLPIWIA